jgi:hypothetical protein
MATTLPSFNLGVEELPESGREQRRLITKTIRIDEELHDRIVDAIHHPRLPFGGHFSTFGNWALEKAVEAAARASNDPEFCSLVMTHRKLKRLHDRHQHAVTFDEDVATMVADVSQWLQSGNLDAALDSLLQLNETLPDVVHVGPWRKHLAAKIFLAEPTQETLRQANAGSSEQMRKAASITAFLEAATGE